MEMQTLEVEVKAFEQALDDFFYTFGHCWDGFGNEYFAFEFGRDAYVVDDHHMWLTYMWLDSSICYFDSFAIVFEMHFDIPYAYSVIVQKHHQQLL